MNICAFDIGSKNFAYAIVRVSNKINKDRHDWWDCIFMECADLSHRIYESLHRFLEERFSFLQHEKDLSVWTILIEQQMGFKSMVNYKAIQIAAHVHAFFLIKFPNIRVIEYPSYLKTRTFGVRFAKKKDRKEWAIRTVSSFFDNQKDEVSKEWLESFKKKDDISDCILMIISFILKDG